MSVHCLRRHFPSTLLSIFVRQRGWPWKVHLSIGFVAKDGLTATSTANICDLNQTTSGFANNSPGTGNYTDAIDGVLGIESIAITFDQLVLSSFTTTTEAAGLYITGISTILPETIQSKNTYVFSTDNNNIVPIGTHLTFFKESNNG